MPDTNFSFLANPAAPNGGLQTIGNIMNIAGGAQALQQRGIEIQKARATLPADIAQRQAEAARAQAEARVSQETADPRIQQQKTAANLAQWQLDSGQAEKAYQLAGGLVADPRIAGGDTKKAVEALMETEDRMRALKIPEDKIRVQMGPLYLMASRDPAALQQGLKNMVIGGINASGQPSVIQPTGPTMASGQVTRQIQTNPFAQQPVGSVVPGTATQQVLPPTTPVYGPNNVPSYLGPQGGGRATPAGPTSAAGGPAAGLQAGPSPLVQGSQATQINAMNSDYGDNAIKASGASQNIGVLEQIKALAPKAITGVEADRRSYLIGMAGLLGISKAQAEKTATDELLKQTSMLVQGAGHTDAERMLVAAMTPNSHMTPEAIKHAADIVISQQRLPLVRQKYMQQFIGDPTAYNQQMSEFNQRADPRILQWKSMTKEERSSMRSAMNPNEKARFLENGKWFEQHGLY